ncbi:MAG: LysE family translocator [Pseudomonadota bacterium]
MTETVLTLLAAWGALAAAAISPGPNMVAVASRGLGSGRRAALTVTLGIALGGFFWAMLTAYGLGLLFEAYPMLLRALGLCGGAYLAWLGFKGWRSALRGGGSEIAPKASGGFWGDLGYGLIVTATNPKVALLWASLSTFVAGVTETIWITLIFAGVSALVLILIYGTYGLVFSASRMRILYERFTRTADALFGSAFGLLGLGMIIRSVRPV